MDSRLVELIMRFRTELISDSTVYTISDWFHATFRAFSFMRKQYEAYRIGAFSCKQEANPIWNENGIV